MTESDRSRRWLPDLLGLAWVVLAGGALMAPALSHGWSLGPFDQLTQLGLTQQVHAAPHNSQVFDLIREIIPWTTLSWTQVHHGILPLWNPFTALGSPLAFNWQAASFSLPALVGYLLPVRLAFTVQVLMTLVIGGTGMYVLARVMRLGVLGATMAATVFELSGSFLAVLGWPIAAVMSWAGWLFAFLILMVRGRHRRRDVTLFAVALALSIYAGEPDTLAVVIVALVVFLIVMCALRIPRFDGRERFARPLLDVTIGSVAGLALAAPLLLPAAQLSTGVVRGQGRHQAFPSYDLLHAIFQTFNGSSLAGSRSFDAHGLGWVSTADYVGVIVVVLAVVGLIVARHRPAVVAFGAVAVVAGCLTYFSPFVALLNRLPGIQEIRWVRSIQVLGFALAILAGVGLDVLVRSKGDRKVRNLLGAGFGAFALLLLLVWAFGRGVLPAAEAAIRRRSFIWPTAEVLIGLAVFGLLVVASRARRRSSAHSAGSRALDNPGRIGAVILLVSSTVFLVALGTSWWSSSTTSLPPTPAITTLQKSVGTSIVGFGISSCLFPPTLGIQPNVNIVYGVHELDAYDPLTPQQLYTSWQDSTGAYPLPVASNGIPLAEITMFCPVVNSVEAARLFGVGYVLEPKNKKGPPGSVFDKTIGDERLYRIPGVSVATLSRLGKNGTLPPVDAPGKPLPVTYPNDQSWHLVTRSSTDQVLRLRLTDVPGWHASIDGRPLPLIRFNRVMLQARIPAGTHTIELHYWPESFTAGIVIASGTAIVLAIALVLGGRRRERLSASLGALRKPKN
jgi:hypothetical protein